MEKIKSIQTLTGFFKTKEGINSFQIDILNSKANRIINLNVFLNCIMAC